MREIVWVNSLFSDAKFEIRSLCAGFIFRGNNVVLFWNETVFFWLFNTHRIVSSTFASIAVCSAASRILLLWIMKNERKKKNQVRKMKHYIWDKFFGSQVNK